MCGTILVPDVAFVMEIDRARFDGFQTAPSAIGFACITSVGAARPMPIPLEQAEIKAEPRAVVVMWCYP
jgi:hypothetical protein